MAPPYGYDPSTGQLTEGTPVSNGPSAADTQLMRDIQQAIQRYGMTTGYYPPTLDALCPTYLPKPPRTEAGELFIYNNQNGYLAHPRQNQQRPVRTAAPRSMPVGGAGPMGEVMTGIGIQNELNGMSNAGVSGVGSRMRSSARGAGGDHNDRQNQAMDDLGL